MNIEEFENMIRNKHPELLSLRVCFTLFETEQECDINHVLDYYVEHTYNTAEILEVLAAIKSIQQKYPLDMDTLNLICLDLTYNYYFLADFKSGVDLLDYITDYLTAKLNELS